MVYDGSAKCAGYESGGGIVPELGSEGYISRQVSKSKPCEDSRHNYGRLKV